MSHPMYLENTMIFLLSRAKTGCVDGTTMSDHNAFCNPCLQNYNALAGPQRYSDRMADVTRIIFNRVR